MANGLKNTQFSLFFVSTTCQTHHSWNTKAAVDIHWRLLTRWGEKFPLSLSMAASCWFITNYTLFTLLRFYISDTVLTWLNRQTRLGQHSFKMTLPINSIYIFLNFWTAHISLIKLVWCSHSPSPFVCCVISCKFSNLNLTV